MKLGNDLNCILLSVETYDIHNFKPVCQKDTTKNPSHTTKLIWKYETKMLKIWYNWGDKRLVIQQQPLELDCWRISYPHLYNTFWASTNNLAQTFLVWSWLGFPSPKMHDCHLNLSLAHSIAAFVQLSSLFLVSFH